MVNWTKVAAIGALGALYLTIASIIGQVLRGRRRSDSCAIDRQVQD